MFFRPREFLELMGATLLGYVLGFGLLFELFSIFFGPWLSAMLSTIGGVWIGLFAYEWRKEALNGPSNR